MRSDSGSIVLDGTTVRYRSRNHGTWDISLSTIRVIGEATNQYGPFADDYFLCFATSPQHWHEASFYAEGREVFVAALSRELGFQLIPGLVNSTDFASRILWPPTLAGQPMFQYTDIAPRNWLARLLGLVRNRQTYSSAVKSAFALE
jgi:hypothetical protein